MYLIAGLGNPGARYKNTRHNIGFKVINLWSKSLGVRLSGRRFQSRNIKINLNDDYIILLRPLAFMNQSGLAVKACFDHYHLKTTNTLVIHDDLDLPLGKIRIRHGASSGGHKGVDSIIDCLGSQDFLRIRVGIGRPTSTGNAVEISEADTIAYVLGDFTPDERQIIARVIPQVNEAILCLLTEGLTATMNKYN